MTAERGNGELHRPRNRRGIGPPIVRPMGVAVCVVLAAMSCVKSSRQARPGDLVWAVGGIDAEQAGPAAAVAQMWNDRHPIGPKVRIAALPQSADDQRQLLAVELNAQIAELDVVSLDVVWTGEFAQRGWLADLAKIRRPVEHASLPGPFRSALWHSKLWAAPYTTNAGFLYYRTDLVAVAPTNWDDLTNVALATAARTKIAPFVGQGAQYEGLVVNYLEYFWGAGGDLFDKDGATVLFQQQPAQRAVDFMRHAHDVGLYPPEFPTMKENDALNAFQSGKAVFMRNWPYAYQKLLGADSAVASHFGIAPLPTFDGEGTISALGGQNLAVSRFSHMKSAAQEFVEFATTNPAVQRELAGRSIPPAMASVYGQLSQQPTMALLGRILPSAKPRPPVPQWSEISDQIQQQIFPAYTGRSDPNQAVGAIRRFLQQTTKR